MGVIPVKNVVLAILVIALTMVGNSDSARSDAQVRFSKWTIHVTNKMESRDVLFLHCKSKDDDLGARNITYNNEFSWTFKENFWRTTLYWCYFSSLHGDATFDVFWPEKKTTWLEFHCDWSDCIWNVKDDGIYLRNIPYDFDDYNKYEWKPKAE